MAVTIFADASVCHETGAAGWAAWIKADHLAAAVFSGSLRSRVDDNNMAELFALANAVHMAERRGFIKPRSFALLQSDSTVALQTIMGWIPNVQDRPFSKLSVTLTPRRKRPSLSLLPALETIVGVMERQRLTIAVRHVRGHTEGQGRQWVNRQCDHAARSAMRAAREALTKENVI